VVVDRQGWGLQSVTANTLSDRCDDAQLGQPQGQGMEKLRLEPVKQVDRETGLNFYLMCRHKFSKSLTGKLIANDAPGRYP